MCVLIHSLYTLGTGNCRITPSTLLRQVDRLAVAALELTHCGGRCGLPLPGREAGGFLSLRIWVRGVYSESELYLSSTASGGKVRQVPSYEKMTSGESTNRLIELSKFQCASNGVGDDAGCIRAAHDWGVSRLGCGSKNTRCTIRADSRKAYVLRSLAQNHVNCDANVVFCWPEGGWTFDGQGARFTTDGGGAFIFENHLEYEHFKPKYYNISKAISGEKYVTLLSASDCSSFSNRNGVASVVRLHGELKDFNDAESNEAIRCDHDTGRLYLRYAIDKPYVFNPAVANVDSITTKGLKLENMHVYLGRGDVFNVAQGASDVRWYRLDLHQLPGAHQFQFWNQVLRSKTIGNTAESVDCYGGAVGAGGFGSSHGDIESNRLLARGCQGGGGVALGGGEGASDVVFVDNTETMVDSKGTCADLTASWNTMVTRNTLHCFTRYGIVTQNGAPADYTAGAHITVINNTIEGTGTTENKLGGLSDRFVHNELYGAFIDEVASSTAGMANGHVGEGGGVAELSANRFHFLAVNNLEAAIVFESTDSALSSIANAEIIINVGQRGSACFRVDDPGQPKAYPLKLIGGVCKNFGSLVLYVSDAAVDLPRRTVRGISRR